MTGTNMTGGAVQAAPVVCVGKGREIIASFEPTGLQVLTPP
ncbi:hypothetical protein CLHUN_16090 [Ruminiclostridium hungatei]|uniref:Uncharacterized protein n=1 Tax=Ruminiclostridium hungatei TaxID=48256 RepID=A0A1V4SMB0_RUMHU|nr:hypothetical protein CLHUN_16090 [Ruminiclostridium hungatei]